jgi:hypothetical protein
VPFVIEATSCCVYVSVWYKRTRSMAYEFLRYDPYDSAGNTFSALMGPEGPSPCSWSPIIGSFLNQLNGVSTQSRKSVNVVRPSITSSSKRVPLLRFSGQNTTALRTSVSQIVLLAPTCPAHFDLLMNLNYKTHHRVFSALLCICVCCGMYIIHMHDHLAHISVP